MAQPAKEVGCVMEGPCKDCEDRVEDEYGLFCDISCGLNTAYRNYQRGVKEVVDWCNENFEPTVPMSLDYKKWHNQLKKWGIK